MLSAKLRATLTDPPKRFAVWSMLLPTDDPPDALAGPDAPLRSPRMLLAAAALALGYLGGVYLGFALTFRVTPVSTLWPPNAILLAALLLSRPRAWPLLIGAVIPAHFIAELSLGVPWTMAACWLVSNTAEAVLGAALIRHYLGRAPRFDRMRDVSVFIAVAGAAVPVITSFLDVAFVALVGWRYGDFWQIWGTRTFSNSLAALTVAPIIVIAVRGGLQALRQVRVAEAVEMTVLFLGLCIASVIVFQREPSRAPSLVLLNLPLPFLLWAAMRRGVGGASLSVAIVATCAILGVLNATGPFHAESPYAAARAMQVFLIIAASSFMLLAASLAELKHARKIAQWQTENLKLALGAAQMGTWEWDIVRDRVTWRARESRSAPSRRLTRSRTLAAVMKSVHPDDRGLLVHAAQRAVEHGGSAEIEFRARGRDGNFRWLSLRGKVIPDETGKPVRLMGVYTDTTERKAQEAQLTEQREQIARLYRVSLLGELSAALAHEVKQPLTAILSNAQAARVALSKRRPDLRLVDDILADIISENRRMTEIIRRLRGLFVRGMAQVQPVDANECLQDVLALEKSYLMAHRVTTTLRFDRSLPPALIDRVPLQQVLVNLIVNACDAMTGRPSHERHLEITTQARDGRIQIDVCDSGTGLPDTETIFAPFFTTKPEGLGLGLAICRTIITAHDGRLWATNNETCGATLHILLPAAPGPAHQVSRQQNARVAPEHAEADPGAAVLAHRASVFSDTGAITALRKS